VEKTVFLYADDNKDDRFLVRRAFEKVAPEIDLQTASSGSGVMAYLKGDGEFANRAVYPKPSVLLLDFRLPPTSALEVVRWVRQQPGFGQLIIVCFSGSTSPTEVHAAYAFGVNSFIEKVATLPELESKIKCMCNYWIECCVLPATDL
jgi:CheY-like chemotaxis protein